MLQVSNAFNDPLIIDQSLQASANAFAQWTKLSLDDRLAQVKKCLQYFVKNRDVIARDITLQMGKPITQSQQEIDTFLSRAEYFCQRLETGTVFANRCDYLDPALAWTGVRNSGKGMSLSKYGFLQMTRPKSIFHTNVF